MDMYRFPAAAYRELQSTQLCWMINRSPRRYHKNTCVAAFQILKTLSSLSLADKTTMVLTCLGRHLNSDVPLDLDVKKHFQTIGETIEQDSPILYDYVSLRESDRLKDRLFQFATDSGQESKT